MDLPQAFLDRITKEWNSETISKYRDSFQEIYHSIRLNPLKNLELDSFKEYNKIPWASQGYYLSRRPHYTWDPAFQAGYYYAQEAGSMSIEFIFQKWRKQYQEKELIGLDACSAPGGKATHILSLLDPDLDVLICNEPIPKRAQVLKDNLGKWGYINVLGNNLDFCKYGLPKNSLDFAVIDAPCSGEGMFRRDNRAVEEWSEENVKTCASRQQNILDHILPSLKPGGLIVYSTCTFNKDENESQLEYITRHGADPFKISDLNNFENAQLTGKENAFRFIPGVTKSEGFYVSAYVIKKQSEQSESKNKPRRIKTAKLDHVTVKNGCLIEEKGTYYAVSNRGYEVYKEANLGLPIIAIGEEKKEKFIPHSNLGYSPFLLHNYPSVELDWEQAQKYLEGETIRVFCEKGIVLLQHESIPLGFGKSVGTRINNLKEKGLRLINSAPSKTLADIRFPPS
ncbi:methyltransferase RsmF C-terminal domain-like protein [Luteibaculum oceani]|nr:hypothetical protein [Luteibaculum oceani]